MPTSVHTPKSISDLVKLTAKHGKRALLVSGHDPADRVPAGKVAIDISAISSFQEVKAEKSRVSVGCGINLGALAREATGENGLLRQAASLIANPLVRNRVTLYQALDPDSPYFDITTPLVLLDSKVRLQGPAGKRVIALADFLEAESRSLKKGEMPVAVEYDKLPSSDRVGFFRVARMGGKGSVSAAVRMRVARNTCVAPEIFVSSLTLIPLRSKLAEKEIGGKFASEELIKRAARLAADEMAAQSEKHNAYEHTLIEITVARTLRSILDGIVG